MVSATPGGPRLDAELLQAVDVLRIDVPGLGERREDVPLLAERFMREISREYGRSPKRLDAESLQALRSHSWPGNVRELQNLMERLLLSVDGDVVTRDHLPAELGGTARPEVDLYGEFESLVEGLQAFERHFIRRTLEEVSGRRDAAAARLDLTVEELERKLGET